FARRTRDGVVAGAAQNLKCDQHDKRGREGERTKAHSGEGRKQRQGHADAEPTQNAAGEKQLNDQSEAVHQQIDGGEECRLLGTTLETFADDARLLEIQEGCGDREQKQEEADAQKIGRLKRVYEARENSAANGTIFSARR